MFWRNAVCLAIVSVCATGCASGLSNVWKSPSSVVKDPGRLVGKPKYEKDVAKIVTIWESSHGKGVDDRNTRGFAGQILFFGPGVQSGGRVHGKVLIYQYDDYDKDSEEEPKLLHTFAFEPDAWEAHRTEGTLGHSYSVFVPYMNRHKDQVNCALKVELISENGQKISSQETAVLLPGKNTTELAAARTRGFVREKRIGPDPDLPPVRAEAGAHQEKNGLESLSIPLPKR